EPPETLDQPGPFGQRYEFLWEDGPALGMVPAHERLAAGNGSGMAIHDRLELHPQFAVPQAAIEVLLAGLGIGGDGAGRRPVGLDATAAETLGVVHGQLGVP